MRRQSCHHAKFSSSPMQGRNESDSVPLLHARLQRACEFPVRVIHQHQDAWAPACNDCPSARMSHWLSYCSMHRTARCEQGASHAVALHEELRALCQDVVPGPNDDVRYGDLACKTTHSSMHYCQLLHVQASKPGACTAASYMFLVGCFDVDVVLPDHAKQVLQAASAGRLREAEPTNTLRTTKSATVMCHKSMEGTRAQF